MTGPNPKLNVVIPDDLNIVYANIAMIMHSPSEILIDLGQVMPGKNKVIMQTRLIMTASNSKLLYLALGKHLEKYEAKYGEIKVPEGGSLAESLFKGSET